MQRYPRFGCKLCPRRFVYIRDRSEHMEKKHGFKPKPLRAGDYGSHYTAAVDVLRAIARQQKLEQDEDGAPYLTGPSASSLAQVFNVTDRAMRKRMAVLDRDGLVQYNRWNGCVVTPRGFRFIDEQKGRR